MLLGCGQQPHAAPQESSPPPPRDANLATWHGGSVIHNSKTFAIFWGPGWRDSPTKASGIVSFLKAFGDSSYIDSINEYYDSSGYLGNDAHKATYSGYAIDYGTPPVVTDNSDSSEAVANEVCSAVGDNPDRNTIYLVYSSSANDSKNSCGWHSSWACNGGYGKTVTYAFLPNIDGEANCQIPSSPQNKSVGSIADVTAHEVVEAITDPGYNAKLSWVDTSIANNQGEVGDKCSWSWPYDSDGRTIYSILTDGSKGLLQMVWSNMAYSGGTGLHNTKDQYGCVYK